MNHETIMLLMGSCRSCGSANFGVFALHLN